MESESAKALRKSLETPEEKRARRLAKKLLKEKKKKEKLGWDDEHLSYTNVDNPFGDPNLHRPFIWKKKFEKEGFKFLLKGHIGIDNVSQSKLLEINYQKQEQNKLELDKVKKRRWLYEKEKEDRQYQVEMMQREKEAQQFREWEQQEDKFHLEQALLRSEIRIKDNRAKPIDLLAKYINSKGEDIAVEINEPYTYLNGLTIPDLEDLLEDIKVYMELEQGKNVEYWKDITTIVADELEKLKQIVAAEKDEYYSHRREGINQSVREDVFKMFQGKTYKQLEILSAQITRKIQTQENIDIGYWESLLKQLHAYMAKARLREKHSEYLKNQLLRIKLEQANNLTQENNADINSNSKNNYTDNSPITNKAEQPLFPGIMLKDGAKKDKISSKNYEPNVINDDRKTELENDVPTTSSNTKMPQSKINTNTNTRDINHHMEKMGNQNASADVEERSDDTEEADEDTLDETESAVRAYERGNYSPPPLISEKLVDKDALISEQDEELRREEALRMCFLKTGSIKYSPEDLMIKEVCNGMALADQIDAEVIGEDPQKLAASSMFSVQVPLEEVYLWSDKYKPRKPRFFNRVHTGFEWNKYNQTHYDFENPPPKVVQGYKFNIFYPDLIDKNLTPQYIITPCYEPGENHYTALTPDFAILRFTAGPPYEDIAFKIVNREWEISYRRGFRCQFYNNIFQLWFHFKRFRYRR